jgi:cation diffusion facilitator CzcD-associated flavoprotein CzcO
VWSHLYSFSFEQNPDWTREYPGQEEILSYLIQVAQKWGLYRYIRFNTEVEEARWNESTKKWETSLKVLGGKAAECAPSYTITSDFLVSAVGQLNVPHYPSIDGLDSFKGKIMHSARWDWSYQMEGKKVAMIGNGATAAQILPEIANVAQSVTVFQRTPNWVIPRNDKPISEAMRKVYRYLPAARKRYRASLMDIRESLYDATVDVDSNMNVMVKQMSLDILNQQIPDNEELRRSLTPDYPPGCKRIIISDDFFPAMNRANVKLETSPIDEVSSTGIKSAGKQEDFDLIILATGFRTLEFMFPIKVFGIGGRRIEQIWKGGARAYLGITVEGFPNFGMLYGPNTNLGHNSIILMIEAQSRYINTLISPIIKSRASGGDLTILPLLERIDSYNDEIQERLGKSTFANPNCNSWYKNADGLVTNNWCGTVVEYQTRTATVEWSDFIVSGEGKERLQSKGREQIGRVVEETQLSILSIIGSLFASAVLVASLGHKSMKSLKII